MEEYLKKLSKSIVNYSLNLKENERVLISIESLECKNFCKYLIEYIVDKKAIPFIKITDPDLNSLLLSNTTDERIECISKQEKENINRYDAYINIKYNINDYNKSIVSKDILKKLGNATKESDEIRINKRKWVLLNYPSILDAFKAKKNTGEFLTYAFESMTFDYQDMKERIKPLKELMEKTKRVRIISPNTDITFNIDGIPVIPCCGEQNIPDGEIFTAPIKDSVNGVITYNVDSPYQGNIFKNVSLTFQDGKIIKCTCDGDDDKLNQIFDTDEGARYVGEFSLGLNPFILNPMGDILYDEKIIGSIHFTPGASYEEAFNGNRSSVHWDMVLIQRKEYGGGELYFDDVLIRKDGLFVLPELKHLNYDLK